MTDKKRDIGCSILFLAFGIFMFAGALPIKAIMGKDLGSGFVPKIVAGAVIAIALLKLVLILKSKEKENKLENDDDKMGGLMTVAALLIYAAIFDSVGFIVSTAFYMFVQITILSDEKNRNLPVFGVISVVAPLAVYALFVYAIKMPLPAGIFGF